MFDITKLDTMTRSEEGVDMVLRNPGTGAPIRDDKGVPVTIKLRGRNSEKFKAAQRTLVARRTELQARGIPWSTEDQKAERQQMLEVSTVGWSLTHMGEEEFPCTPANVTKFWADPRWEWAAVQAYAFVLEEGNFLGI